MSKSIPDRWLDYKPYGEVINSTKILAFKVPLKETVAKNLQPEQQFTTAILMKAQPKLKYVIDLTNTTRYYDSNDFKNAGIKYQKVMIPGMQVPPMEYVKRFFKAMEIFTAECTDDEIIGVHCTHGINRSGYLICRYLVQQLGWKHSDALKAFSDARGHQIERSTYVADLKRAPCNSKIDVSKVNLDAPVKVRKRPPHNVGPRPPFPLMGPPGPPRRGFMNGGPFPPPPPPLLQGKFGPPPVPGFGPPRSHPPPLVGPPVPPPGPLPMFGPPRPPRGPYGPMPPPPGPMRRPPRLMPMGPPVPPVGMPPGPMRRPLGRPRPLPMGPPVPPIRIPPGPPGRAGVARSGPRQGGGGARNKMSGGKRANRANKITGSKQIKDQDFTADVFEENLAKPATKQNRKRQLPKH